MRTPSFQTPGRRTRKRNRKWLFFLLVSGLLLLFSFFVVPEKIVFKSISAFVSGTSNLHDWRSEVTSLDASGNFQITDNVIRSVKDVLIVIKVKDIKSKEGKVMDNKTWEAFKYEKHPNIICSFSMAPVKMTNNQAVFIRIPGKLTMAGVSRSIELTAAGLVLASGDLHLKVSKKLRMTDYGMVPPKAVLGTIKVGDEVTIDFDMVLTR